MSTFPVVLGESLFRAQLPAAIVLLGPVIGGLHVILNLFSSFLQMAGAILYTRLVLRKGVPRPWCDGREPQVQTADFSRKRLAAGFRKARVQLSRIIPVTVIAVLAFTVLTLSGFMDLIGALFQPVLGAAGLPGESSTAIVAQILRSYAGYAVVASLVATGTLAVKTALSKLLRGSMMVITLIYLHYTFPLNISLFGKFGVKITIISSTCSMTAKLITPSWCFSSFRRGSERTGMPRRKRSLVYEYTKNRRTGGRISSSPLGLVSELDQNKVEKNVK